MNLFLFWLIFTGCTVGSDDTLYTWSGYLYHRVSDGEDLLPLDDAMMTLEYLDTQETVTAYQPYDDTEGYWSFDLDKNDTPKAVQIRIESENSDPMIWRAESPNANAIWLSLFTHHKEYNNLFFEQLEAIFVDGIDQLEEATSSHLWGSPLDSTVWLGVEASVTHVETGENFPTTFLGVSDDVELIVLEQPLTEAPVFFITPNLPPGSLAFSVTTSDGSAQSETVYEAKGGEILSAMYYVLWPSN